MNEQHLGTEAPANDISLLEMLNVLLLHRRLIVGLPLLLFALVVATMLLLPRKYTATASFMPQSSESAPAGLAGLASQFGVSIPLGDGGESPNFYADLIESRQVLSDVARSRYDVLHGGERREGTLVEFLEIEGGSPELRVDEAVRQLEEMTNVSVDRQTDVVEVRVTTKAPALSAAIIARMIELVNQFNLETRQSQAAAERRFVEQRLADARQELTAAENRLQQFLQRNRQYRNSPELLFEADRLEREVSTRQEVVLSLTEAYERSRIEEVRNIPVITIVEPPEAPVRPDRRGMAARGLLALIIGGMAAVVLAFALEFGRRNRAAGGDDFAEFRRLRAEALGDLRRPWRLLRRRAG